MILYSDLDSNLDIKNNKDINSDCTIEDQVSLKEIETKSKLCLNFFLI